jgi:hypothetical protein
MDGGTVTVRFSPSERDALREKRRAAGMQDDSAAVRAAIEAWEPGRNVGRYSASDETAPVRDLVIDRDEA